MAPKPPPFGASRPSRDAPRSPAPTGPDRPPHRIDPRHVVYVLGAPSAEASRVRMRACAALRRAIGIMNGEHDTYVMPTL
jgi:hypothetical protein